MRDGFLEEGHGYDAPIVSMDLALLYLRQGRTAELKTLAREMLPIFRSQDVQREAVAALVLFQEAVREEQITAAFVRELAAYLDAARADLSIRFRGWDRGMDSPLEPAADKSLSSMLASQILRSV